MVPTPTDVHAQLTDILVRVVGCAADDVTPKARLKEDLGVDSLTIVEIGDELGRRFDLYLSDDTIDSLVTVYDAINAVVRHDGSTQPSSLRPAPVLSRPAGQFAASQNAASAPTAAARQLPPEVIAHRRSRAVTAAIWLGIVGGLIGLVFGLGGAALVTASGIGNVDLPPISEPSSTTPTPAPTPTPTDTATAETDEPAPTITASSTHVSPGEHFTLEGAFATLGAGATLQVQVKDGDAAWDDFPITVKTKGGGRYKTEIYTSRTGSRQFRMLHRASDTSSPAVTVEIG